MKKSCKAPARNIVDFSAAKKQRDKDRYSDLVMATFDKFERADKRRVAEKKAEVRFKAKEQL